MKVTNISNKPILSISIVYLLSHGFLLFITGRWWDDWCLWGVTKNQLVEWSMEMGRPETIPVNWLLHSLPEGSYRILVFFLFYFSYIFFYKILYIGINLSKRDSLSIALLCVVLPMNDARALECVFPYSLGVFLFLSAFYLLVLLFSNKRRKTYLRIIIHVLFFASFILNSNLVMYATVLIFILYKEKTIHSYLRYADFVCIPLLFFAIKTFFSLHLGII